MARLVPPTEVTYGLEVGKSTWSWSEHGVLDRVLVAGVAGGEEEADALGRAGLEDLVVDADDLLAWSVGSPHESLTMLARWLSTISASAAPRSVVIAACRADVA